ncbi:MAG: glycosyltransferase [Saprospiraceae bacterium]|nr:glycosyltransferase [Saprospiraceae bacterium]
MKLFVITSRFPFPLEKGDKLRLYHQLRVLSKDFEIYLAAISHDEVEEIHHRQIASIVKEVRVFRIGKFQALYSVFKHAFLYNSMPAQSAYFYSASIKKRIQSWMGEVNPDCSYYQLIRTLPYYNSQSRRAVMDLMDAFSTGAAIRAENSKGMRKLFWKSETVKVRRFEEEAIQTFDHLTIISKLDKSRVGESNKISVVNNGIDLKFFKSRHTETPVFDAVFVGNLGYYPNIKAVQYIADILITEIKKSIPGFKINIVGPNKERVVKYASDAVRITGWYEDVVDGYASGKIFLAPLFEGIGQQNKILEAMALGIPCITTPDVADALQLESNTHVLVADHPQAFCEAINTLLNDEDLYNRIGTNAQRLVEQDYRWDAVTAPLIRLLKNEH